MPLFLKMIILQLTNSCAIASSHLQGAKYCMSIVGLSVTVLSCLNKAITDFRLKAQKPLLLQINEASSVTDFTFEKELLISVCFYISLCRSCLSHEW